MDQLQSAFVTAATGQGALYMVVGEPGIGKTATCERLATFVVARAGQSLVGHCHESGSFSSPFQPFVEAVGHYTRTRGADALHRMTASSAAELGRLVPALQEQLGLQLSVPGDPDEDRLRLLQAVLEFLRAAGDGRPLLLVLEDLHHADRGTLDVLLHIARNLDGVRVLVVGTYRDVEVDRAHPLSAALMELRRTSHFQRVHLRGLPLDDVQRLLASASQHAIPRPFAELVHRRTDGNPLFAHEMLRFVVDEGMVERRDGALRRVGEESLVGRIPEGLRDVVGKRLSRLSASTNRALSIASVIGLEFELEVLQRVYARPEPELEEALEEAVAASIIEERSIVGVAITYRFTHAFFHRTLYDEIIAPRRIRLHQQIGRVLEQLYERRLNEHASELAEHYAFSSDTADLTKAVFYGEVAAQRAVGLFAYSEAGRVLERALQVQDVLDPDDVPKRCDLLLALGEALVPAGDTERAMRYTATEALALAEQLEDRRRAFRACRIAVESLDAQGASTYVHQPEYLEWAERSDRYADPESIERVHANLTLANAWFQRGYGRLKDARVLLVQSIALARQHADPDTLFKAAFYFGFAASPRRWNEWSRLVAESANWPRQGASARSVALVLWDAACLALAEGERTKAEGLWRQLGELAEQTHVVTASLFVVKLDALLALIEGRLDEAWILVQRLVARADELGAPARGREFALQIRFALALHQGRAEEYLAAFEEYAELSGPAFDRLRFTSWRTICLAHLGRLDEARALAGSWLDAQEDLARREPEEERTPNSLVLILQAAVLLEHRSAARVVAERLACVAHLAMGNWVYTCVARHLGAAAELCGDPATARAYYVQALESATKIHFRPEIALAHLQLAELLLREDPDNISRAEAVEHLDFAFTELQEMEMQPALERALRLAALLKAPQVRAESGSLTAREKDVAALLAAGRTNRQIAEELVITAGTAEVHVRHILNKLGFKSRSQVARWAIEGGLDNDPPSRTSEVWRPQTVR
jgi:DNA-binding CsgD family transcriptional regulator